MVIPCQISAYAGSLFHFNITMPSLNDVRPTCGSSFFHLSHWLVGVCEKESSHMGKTTEITTWCARIKVKLRHFSSYRWYMAVLLLSGTCYGARRKPFGNSLTSTLIKTIILTFRKLLNTKKEYQKIAYKNKSKNDAKASLGG